MGFTIRGLFLQNTNEAINDPTDKDTEGQDLKERHPPRIKKTIANCRYAYDNDATLRGIILNNIFTTIKEFRIEADDDEIQQYIQDKADEWDLRNIFAQVLLKVMRDGPCFIEKAVIDGSIQVRFLAFDDDKYQFKIIRDPKSGKIIGYKQKYITSADVKNWQNKKFDDLTNDEIEEEANYTTEQIIYPVLIEESGKAKSLIMGLLDTIDNKWTLERFMLSVAHKAGNLIGVTVGNDKVGSKDVKSNFIKKIIENIRNPVEKDVIVQPYGVTLDTVGNNQLPDLPSYLKYYRSEMFVALQSPESLFSTESSNRATAEVQANDKTGYGVFITLLRFFLEKYFERELIDEELKLKGRADLVGKVKILFDETEEIKPLADEKEAQNKASYYDSFITENTPVTEIVTNEDDVPGVVGTLQNSL